MHVAECGGCALGCHTLGQHAGVHVAERGGHRILKLGLETRCIYCKFAALRRNSWRGSKYVLLAKLLSLISMRIVQIIHASQADYAHRYGMVDAHRYGMVDAIGTHSPCPAPWLQSTKPL